MKLNYMIAALTATVAMPIFLAVRMTRHAISPRFAIRILVIAILFPIPVLYYQPFGPRLSKPRSSLRKEVQPFDKLRANGCCVSARKFSPKNEVNADQP